MSARPAVTTTCGAGLTEDPSEGAVGRGESGVLALNVKGLAFAPEHGQIAHTIPGMAGYVSRHHEDLDAAPE